MSDRPKRMGRPVIYKTARRPRLIQLSDELIAAIDEVAGDGKRTQYIEKQLRAIPEIAHILERKTS